MLKGKLRQGSVCSYCFVIACTSAFVVLATRYIAPFPVPMPAAKEAPPCAPSTKPAGISYDLADAVVMDRMDGYFVDVAVHWRRSSLALRTPSYHEVRERLHGDAEIFDDALLGPVQKSLGIGSVFSETASPTARPQLLKNIVRGIKPKLVVELGVFRGWTSITLAKELAAAGLNTSFVVSIDTWLLDLRFVWRSGRQVDTTPGGYFHLPQVAAGSQMYLQFIHNVVAAGMQTRIIPMQSATMNANHAFVAAGWGVDVIYIDASHASFDCFIDMTMWWPLVSCGGLMLGDDFNIPAVRRAVDAFAAKEKLAYERYFGPRKGNDKGGAWVFAKKCPSAPPP